jgi:glutamate mutase epsilon subunit
VAVAGPATMEPRVPVPFHQHEQHAGQSVGAPNINSLHLDNSMLRIVAAIQQFMTEFNGAMSEEEKIVTITKIVSNVMKQNDH